MGAVLQTGRKRKVAPYINVAPLVDVVLVLLIIFMVITPMMNKQLSVAVPTKDDKQAPSDPAGDPEPQVVLQVDVSGQFLLNQAPIGDGELGDKLRRVFAVRSDHTLFFDADDDVAYGRAMEALDIARGVGIRALAVLTEPLGRHDTVAE